MTTPAGHKNVRTVLIFGLGIAAVVVGIIEDDPALAMLGFSTLGGEPIARSQEALT